MRIDDDTPPPGSVPEIYPKRPPVNFLSDPASLNPPNLFAFEGIDGAGKSQVIRDVARVCAARGREASVLKLGRSEVTGYALERAKWLNSNPLTINLLNWIGIYEQFAEGQAQLDSGALLFLDRYVLTIRVRGLLEGIPRSFTAELEHYAPRPRLMFLIDCDPELCARRIIGSGRPITYFEAGSRIVDGEHVPMIETDPGARRASSDRTPGLLAHLTRMRAAMLELAAGYDNVVIVDNAGPREDAVGTIIEAIENENPASTCAGEPRGIREFAESMACDGPAREEGI